jgi:multimeric flavodoxin WrbA
MRILGISGSPRKEDISGVSKLVKTVLEASGCDYEYVSLRGKKIGGCIACLQCVEDNICKVKDDLTSLRDQIVVAEAYVIGAPNYYTGINATTQALLERWFQFRHQAGNLLWGKLAVVVGVGGSSGQPPADDLEKYMAYNFIETIAKVRGQGAASCFSCGFGETCPVGIPRMLYGDEVKITDEMIPDVSQQPEVMQAAEAAGKLLGGRLRQGVDRQAVTQKMMQAMMEKFKGSA